MMVASPFEKIEFPRIWVPVAPGASWTPFPVLNAMVFPAPAANPPTMLTAGLPKTVTPLPPFPRSVPVALVPIQLPATMAPRVEPNRWTP